AGEPVVRTAVALVRARAGPGAGARAVGVAVAGSVQVRAGVAGLVADRADLDAGGGREEVAVEVEDGAERQAQVRRARVAVRGAARVRRDDVDDADAGRRAHRVRDRERRAEEAADARAVPVAARRSRGEVREVEVTRPAVARVHGGERGPLIGHVVRKRNRVAAAAGVETAAREVQACRAVAQLHRAAVPAADAGREAEAGRVHAAARAGDRRGRRAGRDRGRGARGRGRRRRGRDVGRDLGVDVVDERVDLVLDGRVITGRRAAALALGLRERAVELVDALLDLQRVDRAALGSLLRVETAQALRLLARGLQLRALAAVRGAHVQLAVDVGDERVDLVL